MPTATRHAKPNPNPNPHPNPNPNPKPQPQPSSYPLPPTPYPLPLTHQGTFVFYSDVPSTPVAIYLCQSDTGVLKVPR